MAIQTYSLKLDGNKQLSANFKVSEFACKDGSDQILICDSLVKILQWVRDHFGKPITITSAYRTKSHNAKVGGACNSQHLYGTAADIVVAGVDPLAVAQFAESVMVNGGIGYYPAGEGSFTHIDTRQVKYRWQQQNGRSVTVSGFGGQVAAKEEETMAIKSKKFCIAGDERSLRAALVGGENYIHLQELMELLGMQVGYGEGGNYLTLDFATPAITVNGAPVELPGIIVVGNTMVGLRAVIEALGGSVDYDAATGQISVKTA